MSEPEIHARLLCRTGDLAGATFDVGAAATIGRGSDSDVVVESRRVSRHHARIWREEGRYWIEDLDSLNGTRVDDDPVTGAVPLESLNVITFADDVDFVFVAQEGTTPERPERGATVADLAGFGRLPDLDSAEPAAADEVDEPVRRPTVSQQAGFGAIPELDDEAEPEDRPVPEDEPEPEDASTQTPTLSVSLPDGTSTFTLEPGRHVLGRSAECDIVLPDPETLLSRQHAAVSVEYDGSVTLTDLDSANGTWMAGERVDKVRLNPGDTFKLGPHLEITLTTR